MSATYLPDWPYIISSSGKKIDLADFRLATSSGNASINARNFNKLAARWPLQAFSYAFVSGDLYGDMQRQLLAAGVLPSQFHFIAQEFSGAGLQRGLMTPEQYWPNGKRPSGRDFMQSKKLMWDDVGGLETKPSLFRRLFG